MCIRDSEYRNAGLSGVTVMAEWMTAGVGVCPECAALEGKVFSLDTIEGMIPLHPNCFLDPQIPVYTLTGWKPIGSVRIGDYVLTHEGRFRKVYALPRSEGHKDETEVVRLCLTKEYCITITANHPILVESEVWKHAGSIEEGDHVSVLTTRCEECGDLIPYFGGRSCCETVEKTSAVFGEAIVDLGDMSFASLSIASFPIQKVEHWRLRENRRLYNLSVEEDESYLAKGIVVHNCRCVAIPALPEHIPEGTTIY